MYFLCNKSLNNLNQSVIIMGSTVTVISFSRMIIIDKGGKCYLLFLLGGITGGPPLISRLKQRSEVKRYTTDKNTVLITYSDTHSHTHC